MTEPDREEFQAMVAVVEPRLRRALVAAYGFDKGREATAAALAWAWEHRRRLRKIDQKVAYLFRVGQSSLRVKKTAPLFEIPHHEEPWIEPRLGSALAALSERQRIAVVLVYGFRWTLAEVADLTGTRIPTVQTHLERGLRHLRAAMEVSDHA